MKKKNNLVLKAKQMDKHLSPNKIVMTKDEVVLCVAYLNEEISTRQYAHAIGAKNPGNVTHRVSVLLRWAIIKGYITIKIT